jgi:hypothetical protein
MLVKRGGRFHDVSSQVEPLAATISKAGKPNPVEDTSLVAPALEDRVGGRAIHEMQPTPWTVAFEEEAADAVSRQAGQVILQPPKRKADDLNEPFRTPRQCAIESQESLPMTTKAIQADRHRPADQRIW